MLSIIVACCRSGAIGREGRLLHRISEDLEFFKNTTFGHRVIVGRKTYESIPNRLPGREVIVVTSNADYVCPVRSDIIITENLEEALSFCREGEETFVVGGASIYQQALPFVEKIYLTRVEDDCVGDAYFEIDFASWEIIERKEFVTKKGLRYERLILLRRG